MSKTHTRRLAIVALSALYLPAYVQTGKVSLICYRRLMWSIRLDRSVQALPPGPRPA